MRRGPQDRITLDPKEFRDKIQAEDSLDEIVISNCMVHLERMTKNRYYLGIYDGDGLMLQVSIYAQKKPRAVVAMLYGDENTEGIEGDVL